MSDHDVLPDLPVAAYRALPDDVRERMRDRITRDRKKAPARRGPLAVAAAVVLLAAGGVVVAGSAKDDAVPAAGWSAVPENSVTTEPSTARDLRQCDVDWQADYTVVMRGRRIVVGPENQFCELTYTSVRTSTTRYPVVIGDGVVVWQTPGHITMGKAPKGSTSVTFSDSGTTTVADALTGAQSITTMLPGGRFVVQSARQVDILEFESGGWQPLTMRITKADLPTDGWSTTRWAFPSGTADPTTPENRTALCLDGWLTGGPTGTGLPEPSDTAKWEPVVGAGDPVGVQMIRDPDRLAFCEFRLGELVDIRVGRDPKLDRSQAPLDLLYRSGVPADGRVLLAGRVRPGVGKLMFTAPGGPSTQVVVANGGFAVSLPT
ncbi:MAG: hypothetical protein ABWY11_11125, partial [Umezawaea sp.]